MKKICLQITLFLVVSGLFTPGANAGIFDTSDYDQCLIQSLSDVKLNMVANELVRICDESYKNTRFVSKEKKAYNRCLVDNLTNVESEVAAQEIIKACGRLYLK